MSAPSPPRPSAPPAPAEAAAAAPPGQPRDASSSHTPSAFHPVSHSSGGAHSASVPSSGDWKRQQQQRARQGSSTSRGSGRRSSSLSSAGSSEDEESRRTKKKALNGAVLQKKPSEASNAASVASAGHEGEDEDEGESSAVEKREDDDEDRFAWPNLGVSDERRQLLGAEEESSDRLSSDEEEDDDESGGGVWAITREQLNYYTTQFFSMQPNPHGVLPGALAKEFFEKSRLPIAELRQIWQLSDVTKDGCLSLEEFLTAMHLVVLRRNDLALPDDLPFPLQPERLRQRLRLPNNPDRHNKAHYEGSEDVAEGEQHLLRESSGAEETKTILSGAAPPRPPAAATAGATGGAATATTAAAAAAAAASPGPKPVNFDFDGRADALRRNYPNLVQPVALRVSPESPVIPTSDDEESLKPTQVRQGRREVVYEQLHNAMEGEEAKRAKGGVRGASGREGVSSAGRRKPRFQQSSTSPPSQDLVDGGEDEDASILTLSADDSNVSLDERGPLSLPPGTEAPPPPSSITKGASGIQTTASAAVARQQHMRSSSLDLNSTKGVVLRTNAHPPPELPPRAGFRSGLGSSAPGRRPEARTYEMNIHQFREKNSVIARTINELHQEVSDALEERIALEYQLEQLKSFGE